MFSRNNSPLYNRINLHPGGTFLLIAVISGSLLLGLSAMVGLAGWLGRSYARSQAR